MASLLLEDAQDSGLQLVSHAAVCNESRLGLFEGGLALFLGRLLLITSTATAGVEGPVICALSDSRFRDYVCVLASGGLGAYIADVASACTRQVSAEYHMTILWGAMAKSGRRMNATATRGEVEKPRDPNYDETHLLDHCCMRHRRGFPQHQLERLHRQRIWCRQRRDCPRRRGREKLQQSWVLIRG